MSVIVSRVVILHHPLKVVVGGQAVRRLRGRIGRKLSFYPDELLLLVVVVVVVVDVERVTAVAGDGEGEYC